MSLAIEFGSRIGRLLVLGFKTRRKVICLCECNAVKVVDISNLMAGRTRSCGCSRNASISAAITKHGHAKRGAETTEHAIWHAMMQRCYLPSNSNYSRYGKRGITVCDRWHDFRFFYSDMGPRPSLKHSIDRIDNNGNYELSNCRWATSKQQSINKSNTVFVELNGERLPLIVVCEREGLHYENTRQRLARGFVKIEQIICEKQSSVA